jgi:transcriptional regulator with XRE-family HTH domain
MEYDYAKAFRIVRAAFGLQQSELAARMSISASQLSLIEAGKRQPSLRVVNALADAVGIPTAMVSLLATPPKEIGSKEDHEISDLARALLRLLVSAQEQPQQSLRLEG